MTSTKLFLPTFSGLIVLLLVGCGKQQVISDPVNVGPLISDPASSVTSADGKYLCDFQWTTGPEAWNYGNSSGDQAISSPSPSYSSSSSAYHESWCLLPYGATSTYSISVDRLNGDQSLLCHDLDANYSINGEAQTQIGEGAHSMMACVNMTVTGTSAASNVMLTAGVAPNNDPSTNTRLYFVEGYNNSGKYSIQGHLDLMLVQNKTLHVLFTPILNTGVPSYAQTYFPDQHTGYSTDLNDLETYMSKVGYSVSIAPAPVYFPNELASRLVGLEEGELVLPTDLVLINNYQNIANVYNGALDFIANLWSGFSGLKTFEGSYYWDYTIALTPSFGVKATNLTKTYNGTNCQIMIQKDVATVSELQGSANLMMHVYDASNNEVGNGGTILGGDVLNINMEKESDCNSVSYGMGEVVGNSPFSVGMSNGSLLFDPHFNSKVNKGRLLAGVLYAKILGQDPFSTKLDGRWLSSYQDLADVEVPSRFWSSR